MMMTTQVSSEQVDTFAVLEHVCKGAGRDFGRRLFAASPEAMKKELDADPRFWRALDKKFSKYVMDPKVTPSQLVALDQHPIGSELIARAMYTKGYDGEVAVEGVSDRTRELMMTAARSSEPRQGNVNVCRFIPPPDVLFEDRKTLSYFISG